MADVVNGTPVDEHNVEDEKLNLLILLGQTSSVEEIKSLLNQLNSSLLQIGKLAEKHRDELLNVIRMQQFDQFNFDQPYRIYYNNESNFEFELLLNATLKTFKQSMRTFMHNLTITMQTPPLRERKYFINLTNDSSQNGDLNLQDGLFTYDDLNLLINEQSDDVKKLLKSSWSAASAIPKLTFLLNQRLLDANKNWKLLEKNYPLISLNAIGMAADSAESRFSSELELELEKFFNKVSVDQLMQNSKSTGTLKITKPCLYIFPASQGDSAYFAVNGYSMLINGGYDKLRPCFWKFINMLQQIDSVLITHTDSDSLGGLSSFFKKKLAEPDTKPAVLSVLGNLIPTSNGRQPSIVNVAANLISNEVGSSKQAHQSDVDQIIDAIDKLQVKLLPLVKTNENLLTSFNRSNHALNKYEHINLYYKLGHGSLDLYVLSPYVNSIEYKEHYQQQHHGSVLKHMANQKSHLAVQQIFRHLPLSHLATSVVLLVWLPAAPTRQSASTNADNNALRLLFTGNAPQHVIFNALDKIKDFELLNEPVYRVKATESSTTGSANAAGGRKTSQVVKDSSSSFNNSQVANGSSARPASKTSQSTGAAAAASSSASAKPAGEKSTSAGQMNGSSHHGESKSQPNAAAGQTKSNSVASKPPKPAVGSASSKDKDSSATGSASAAKDSSAKTEASGSAKPEATKKHPPIPSHNVASASKAKKPAEAAESSSSASASAEKPDTKAESKEKKPSSRPSVSSAASNVKKELINGAGEKATTNGTTVKQSQSETSASADAKPSLSASGTSRSSLAKQDSAASKPAGKPQSAPSTSKPPATSKSSTGATASSTGDKKESSAKKPSSASGRSSTAGQTEPKNVVKKEKSAKTLSLSVDNKSAPTAVVATAAAAATAVAASAVIAGASDDAAAVSAESVPTPEAVEPNQSTVEHEPSKNDSVEVPKQEQEESTSEMTERVVHEEQIEQIEKIEQVVNVEQQIEQIEQSLKEPIVELENVHLHTAEPTNKDEFVALETQPAQQQQHQQPEADVQVQHQHQPPVEEQPPVVESEVDYEQKYEHVQEQEQQQPQNLIDVSEPEPATPTTPAPSGQFASESPNLSPVKKDFSNINGESNLVDDDGVVVVAPVVEEQLTATNGGSLSSNQTNNDADLIIESNTNGSEFEIVSGNLNPVEPPAAEPVVDQFYRANDDVMTRSFIEDESNPQSNPFNNVDSTNNGPLVTPVDPAPAVNGHKNLDESECDLNRTHELFEGEDSSIIQEDSVSKSVPSEIEDKLINGIESLKLDSHHQHNDQDPSIQLEPVETARGDEPEQWNLLELPSPVNPIDPISPLETQSKLAANELNHDLNTSNQQAPLIEELPVSSDFTPTNASNVPGSAEKKSLINGKKAGAQQSSTRASVDSANQAANKTKANQTSSQNQAQKQTNKPTHPVHVHPVYVELTYIPAHGNDHYCDAEFFKRVRARHYVLSSVEPTENILNALCDGKEQWEDKNLQVSLVPTYESETLRKWFLVNEERLTKLKIDILPAANNATITIEDNADLTCQVYKLEF